MTIVGWLNKDRQPNTLQRSEVVALFNTFHRISESINNIEVFRELYEKSKIEPEIWADPLEVAIDYKGVDYKATLVELVGLLQSSLYNAARSLIHHAHTLKQYAYDKLSSRHAKATSEL